MQILHELHTGAPITIPEISRRRNHGAEKKATQSILKKNVKVGTLIFLYLQ